MTSELPSQVTAAHVSVSFADRAGLLAAVRDFSFSFMPGRVYTFVGPSGCGKTTLLYYLAGLLTAGRDPVELRGELDPPFPRPYGFSFQKPFFLEWRDVMRNILLFQKLARRVEDPALVIELLDQCGIGQFANARPSQLSGGMLARAALVRTLAISPRTVFLDEAFNAIDEIQRQKVLSLVRAHVLAQRCFALNVTHDIMDAIRFSDEIIVLSPRPAAAVQVISVREVSGPDLLPVERAVAQYAELQRALAQWW